MSMEVALAAGIGTPVAYSLLKGIGERAKVKFRLREFAIVGLSAFAVTALASQYLTATPAASVSVPCGQPSMSVSSVTAQLGRYAGGVRYPGQMTGGTETNGDLIFID